MIDFSKGIYVKKGLKHYYEDGMWRALVDDVPQDIVKEINAYIAKHPEVIVPAPKPSAEEIERQRVAGIMASLAALDARAIRPMRAKLAGSATVQDEETLAEIEAEVKKLRGALSYA